MEEHPCWREDIDLDKLEEMYLDGAKKYEITEELDIALNTLNKRIEYLNLEEKFKQQIIKKFKSGIPLTHLIEKYHRGYETIKKIIENEKLPVNLNKNHHKHIKKENFEKIKSLLLERVSDIWHCSNLCLIDNTTKDKHCSNCPIKNKSVKIKNYFDFVITKNKEYYIAELKKSSDRFTFNQVNSLLTLLKNGVNICLIEVTQNYDIENIIYYKS